MRHVALVCMACLCTVLGIICALDFAGAAHDSSQLDMSANSGKVTKYETDNKLSSKKSKKRKCVKGMYACQPSVCCLYKLRPWYVLVLCSMTGHD